MVSHAVSHSRVTSSFSSRLSYFWQEYFLKPPPRRGTWIGFIFIPTSATVVLQRLQCFIRKLAADFGYIDNRTVESDLVIQPLAVCWLIQRELDTCPLIHCLLPFQNPHYRLAYPEAPFTDSFTRVTSRRSPFEESNGFVLRSCSGLLKDNSATTVKGR